MSTPIRRTEILVIEPSPFRRDETYVKGPYSPFRAWWEANLVCLRHPYAQVNVVSSKCTITMGDCTLWPPKEES